MATETNFELFRGNDATLNFTQTGTDITGWTIVFNMARDGNMLAKVVTNRACSLVTPLTGGYRAVLTAAEIGALEPGDYQWDATRTDTGSVTTLGYGTARVRGIARLPSA